MNEQEYISVTLEIARAFDPFPVAEEVTPALTMLVYCDDNGPTMLTEQHNA